MLYGATQVEDSVTFQRFRSIDMGDDPNLQSLMNENFDECVLPEEVIDVQQHSAAIPEWNPSLQIDFFNYSQEQEDDLEAINPFDPTNSGSISEHNSGEVIQSSDENALSLEKALTDAVGDALSLCFQEDWDSDDMFIDDILSGSLDSPSIIEEDEFASVTSSSIHSKSTTTTNILLYPRTTRFVTAPEPKTCSSVDTFVYGSQEGSGTKRTTPWEVEEQSNPKRSALEAEDTNFLKELENTFANEEVISRCDQLSLSDRDKTHTAASTQVTTKEKATEKSQSMEKGDHSDEHPLEPDSQQSDSDSKISAMMKQVLDWKKAAQTAFEAARKIRAQMELEKFRADRAETTLTQLTARSRAKAENRRSRRVANMRRSQSLTHDATQASQLPGTTLGNIRPSKGMILENISDEPSDNCKIVSTEVKKRQSIVKQQIPGTSAKSRKMARCQYPQINDKVRLALRAKVRTVRGSTLHTADDIVKQTQALVQDLL